MDTGAKNIFHDMEDVAHDTFGVPKLLPGRRRPARAQGYYVAPQRSAQCCPVCGGRGSVQAGFYNGHGFTDSTAPVTCRTCGGSGMVTV